MKKTIIIISILIIIVLLSVYFYYQNNFLQTSNYIVKNENIPEAFDNYKIIQISDYHNVKSNRLNNDLVKSIKDEKPNIIVITGDLIDSRRTDVNSALSFLEKIKDIAPCFYVTGNHEAAIKEYSKIKHQITKSGVIILENTHKTITIDNQNIEILGLKDPLFYPKKERDKINKKLEKVLEKADKDNFKILLSHRPEFFDVYSKYDIGLVLSGHAHGGQFRLPFIGGLFAPGQGFFPKYTSGIFEQNGTNMIVSRGIGKSSMPFRINNRPELIVITLKSN